MSSGQDCGKLRVYILDHRAAARDAFRGVLEGVGMTVVGESASAAEASVRIPALRPDVALLAGRVVDGTGSEVCWRVRSADPAISCLILAVGKDENARGAAVLAGAAGFLPQQVRRSELVSAVRGAAAGRVLFAPEEEERAFAAAIEQAHPPRRAGLNVQESRVLELLRGGMTDRQIAHEMALAQKTAEHHVSSVLAKLGLRDRTQAARHTVMAARRGHGDPAASQHAGVPSLWSGHG